MLLRRKYYLLLCLFFCSQIIAQYAPTPNSASIYLQLKKLNVLGSVLYIAAHPDDENNQLLPYLAKGRLYRTGYLSLTRGEGGQNLIGSEQGIELGLIRTQELLAARRIDGAEQFFSRAYEFGFSKNAAEALRIWDKQKVLSDIVWVIRNFKPDVIITRFPMDARAGHGHHWASAILANEAFVAAADATKFPEQFQYGVQPWQAKRIFWNTFNFGSVNTTANDQIKIDMGGFNPLLGESYGELGAEARSMHKSQGEGRPRRRGESFEYFKLTGGDTATNDLMDGITTDWKRLNGGAAIQTMIDAIIKKYDFQNPAASVSDLVQLYKHIKALPESYWQQKKLHEVQDIIESCSGLFAEATTTQPSVAQGEKLKITFGVNVRSTVNATLKNASLASSKANQFDTSVNVNLQKNANTSFEYILKVDENAALTQPYWLKYPQNDAMFDVRDQLLIGKAENAPAFQVNYLINIEGEDFMVQRPVQYKYVDAAKGELYQPLAILPKLEVGYIKENFVSLNGNDVAAEVKLKSNTKLLSEYEVRQYYSDKWKNNFPIIRYTTNGSNEHISTTVFTPHSEETNVKEEIKLKSEDGKYDSYTKTISYDHIPTITYFPKAKANLVKLDIKIVGRKIGYIIGAGDKVPEALTAMGYEVQFLSEKDITEDNLKQFDAIVTGIRAYNIYECLTDKNEVLSNYVKNGGNLIVQYLKSNVVGAKKVKVGPYPFQVNAGLRVTEEDAKVHFLLPESSALNYPNKITDKDFEGWVQERSTYQAEQLDNHFETPLGMNDTNEKESNGSLAIAKYGKGNFVYLSLVMFRELPAGNPGAYRLMANLIALPQNK